MRELRIVAVLLILAVCAQAETMVFYLNTPFVGNPSPTWTGPQSALVMSFTQTVANTVQLTLSTANLSSTEAIKAWYLNTNFQGALNISWSGGVQGTISPLASNAYRADGTGGYFDLMFSSPTQSCCRFYGGMTSVYTLTGNGLTLQNFNIPASGSVFWGAAQVIGMPNGQSAWVGTPEPSSYILLSTVTAVLGFALFRRRKLLNRV